MILIARTMADLISKIYEAEGWVRSRGESKVYRAQTAYKIKIDHKGNRFVAVRMEKLS
jgi:glycerol dehydrogenase-like iron-containing ADH family enzyme